MEAALAAAKQMGWRGIDLIRHHRAREWVIWRQVSAFAIFSDVSQMVRIVSRIGDPMFVVNRLPDFKIRFKLEGEAALDELNSLFKRDFGRGSDEKVKVIRHDHESVRQVAVPGTVLVEQVQEQEGVRFNLEKPASLCDHDCQEKVRIACGASLGLMADSLSLVLSRGCRSLRH